MTCTKQLYKDLIFALKEQNIRISQYILDNFLYFVANHFQSRRAQVHSKRQKNNRPYLKSIITTDKRVLKVNAAMHSPV